jgi:hypothetical protein
MAGPGIHPRLGAAPSAAFNFDRGALTPESFRFAAEAPATIAAGKEGAARRFEGVAYSGDVIKGHFYWGDVVFDLSSTKAAQKLPMLVGHDNEKIAGFSDSVKIGQQIDIAGALSSKTPFGQEVAALSDEGFPWQMSVRIEPAQVDEVGKGKSVQVNGRTFSGPITVFRNSVIREVSFTPTGWDAQTSATAMARGIPSPDEGVTMTPEEIAALQAEAAKAKVFEKQANDEKAAREKAEADAAKEKADKVAAFEKADRSQGHRARDRREGALRRLRPRVQGRVGEALPLDGRRHVLRDLRADEGERQARRRARPEALQRAGDRRHGGHDFRRADRRGREDPRLRSEEARPRAPDRGRGAHGEAARQRRRLIPIPKET